jgi:pimeloyl-ACP methyl ester carboxylesterase
MDKAAESLALPRMASLLAEVGGLAGFFTRRAADRAVPTERRGDGRSILVIPGFLASDASTTRLRSTLNAAGYRAHGWKMGTNFGARIDLLDLLQRRIDRVLAKNDGRPVALVGWSLGGVYARELAKLRPDDVDRVITLGSPFSGDPRANHAWRLYEWVNRHPVDNPPIAIDRAAKPPVKTIALWSNEDGIVSAPSARGLPGEADHSIAVNCKHLGFTTDPCAISAIFDALEL